MKLDKKGKPMTKHTMFPEGWDTTRIRKEVTSAWEKRKLLEDKKWKGITPSGVPVEGFVSPKRTAYPIFEQ